MKATVGRTKTSRPPPGAQSGEMPEVTSLVRFPFRFET